MRKIYLLIFVAIIIVSCCNTGNKTADKPLVTVTIPPQKFFIEKIAKDYIDVNVIVPPGISPEEYEPSPQHVQKLSNSDIYFFIGHLGFEKNWLSRFDESAPDVDFVSCSKGIDLMRGYDQHCTDDGEEHHHAGTDPHIWTSPENVKTISRNIAKTLQKHYPDKADEFETNLKSFIQEINALDNSIRAMFADSVNHSFMIFHPSLGYFSRDYHLTQLSVEFEGKSPSAAHMKKMIDAARQNNIKSIFVQSQFEVSKAEAIAHEIGANVVSVDPLAENWLAEMDSIAIKIKNSITQ